MPRLVSRDLWLILMSMKGEQDAVLGESLTELRAAVERRLCLGARRISGSALFDVRGCTLGSPG